jgi:hypothetical protein
MPSNKKKSGRNSKTNKTPTLYKNKNDLPRAKIYAPEGYEEQCSRLNPVNDDGVWYFHDGDHYIRLIDNKNKLPPVAGHCPVCFKTSSKTCSRCSAVSYCSPECQKKHWKDCHKKACSPNPNLYPYTLKLDPLIGLSNDFHTPHEFMLIKPTEQLSAVTDICEQVLESADHIMDIPGFGSDQIQVMWPVENTSHPLQKQICDTFGWNAGTGSGVYGVEIVEGYRMAEDIYVYMVLNDDCFQSPSQSPGLATSFYGGSIYPSVIRKGKQVRGNIVIYKILIKNKRLEELSSGGGFNLLMQVTDDSTLRYEYEMYPISKLEIALMLQERRKALEQGAYSRRMWRAVIRQEERQVEMQKQMASGSTVLEL